MSTTEDTSAIDDKKTEDTGTPPADFKGFIFNYIYSIVFTIIISIFIIGGIALYTTKVVKAENILPINIDYAPYTDKLNPNIANKTKIEINIMRPHFFSDETHTTSQTVNFKSREYLDSFVNSIICSLKSWANPKNTMSNYGLYFSKVYDLIVSYNFWFINFIYGTLGFLPESIIMILFGLFGPLLYIVLFLFNNAISIIFHIINLGQIFKGTTTISENELAWSKNTAWGWTFIWNILLFFVLGITLCFASAFVIPIFFTIYALLAPLYVKYDLLNTDTNSTLRENQTFFDFIKSTFVYKKFLFFILATISLVYNGMNYLGTSSLIGIVIAIIIVYMLGLYNNSIPTPEDGDGFRVSIPLEKPPVIKKPPCPPIPEEGVTELEEADSWSATIPKKGGELQKGGKRVTKPKKIINTTTSINPTNNNPFKKYNIRLI